MLGLIESWNDLPRAAGSHLQERVWFDLKTTYPPRSQSEIAKDVASFANALGGVLIVGAREGPTEPDYRNPLSADYAARIEEEVDQAVRDYCRPSPTVHVRTIPVPDAPGSVILALNVQASPEQPVAARHESDQNTWRFPQRVGRHTEFILPEQLPLYMNSKARRAKLLLFRALDEGADIDLFTVPSGSHGPNTIQGPIHFAVAAVDVGESAACVFRDLTGDFEGQSATVPLDDIEAVWKQHTGRWAARLSGRFEWFDVRELTYLPPATFVVAPLKRLVEKVETQLRDISRRLADTIVVEHHARQEPTHDDISRRAHQLWLLRVERQTPGSQEDDWLRARQQLLKERRE